MKNGKLETAGKKEKRNVSTVGQKKRGQKKRWQKVRGGKCKRGHPFSEKSQNP